MSTAVAPARSSSQSKSAAPLDRLVLSISRNERLYGILVVSLIGLLVVYEALTYPIWFDEFFTLCISRLSSFPEMLKAMPADGQPPLQYLLVHPFLKWLGPSELALRLPAMLSWMVAGLLTWRIVRVHGTAVQALFALAVMLGSSTGTLWLSGLAIENQAFTARPYQTILALTALAFLCWQSATMRENRRTLSLLGLTFAIALAVCTHHFAIIQIGAFLVTGEIVRSLQRGRLDLPLLACAAAGLLPLIFTVPLAIQTHRLIVVPVHTSANYWNKASLADIYTWPAMTPWLVFLPLSLLACLPESSPPKASAPAPLPPVPRHELAAATALVLLSPAQLLLAMAKTGYFFPRYAIGATLGFALLLAWAWPTAGFLRGRADRALALLTLIYLCVVTACLAAEPFIKPLGRANLAQSALSPVSLDVPGDLPIVDANGCDYPQEYWYAPPALQHRLIYLSDLPYAIRQPGFVAEVSLVADREITPFPIAAYSTFIATHPHFFVLRTGKDHDNWLPQRLQQSGWHLSLLRSAGRDRLYRADRP